MGVRLQFDQYAAEVRSMLWVLEVEPAYESKPEFARFMWEPYVAQLEPLGPDFVRLSLSSHGELLKTIDLPMDDRSVKLAADGIIAVFEPA